MVVCLVWGFVFGLSLLFWGLVLVLLVVFWCRLLLLFGCLGLGELSGCVGWGFVSTDLRFVVVAFAGWVFWGLFNCLICGFA